MALAAFCARPQAAEAAPPSCGDVSATVAEDSAANAIVLPGCTDPDLLQVVTCALDVAPANGSATVNPTCLAATYTPNANFCGSNSFTYIGTDNGGPPESDLGTVSITVTCSPDTPTCSGTSVTTDEDTMSAAFSLNCSDADVGDTITCAVTVQGLKGSVAVTNCGSATYAPNLNENGADAFTYTATDGTLTSLPATGTVTINAVNDPPVCADTSATVTEDSVTNAIVLPGCTDPDMGQVVTCALGTPPTNGSATVATCLAGTYTPNANFCGSDSLTYTGTDNGTPALSDPGTVSITVTCVNDAPSCSGTSVTADEDTTSAAFSLNCSDVDSGSITCVVTVQGLKGTVTVTNCGSATYVPNLNENGADAFTYEASDETLTSLPAAGTVTINPVNDQPTCPDAIATVLEDAVSAPVVLPGCTDPDAGQVVTCSLDTAPASGSATVATCLAATYTPTANFCGNDSFTYIGTDNGVPPLPDTGTVSVTVTCVADAPSCAGSSVTTNEDSTSASFSLNCSDADVGDTITCSVTVQGLKGTTTVVNCGSATYAPNANQSGADAFTYTASDGTLTSLPATGTVTINPLPDAPVCGGASASVVEDAAPTPIVLPGCTDADAGQLVTCALGVSASNGSATINATCLLATYTPNPNFCGNDSFSYIGTDTDAPPLSGSATVTVTVACSVDPPICLGATAATTEDTPSAPFSLNCSDVDNEPITCTISVQGTKGIVIVSNCFGTYLPNSNETGADAFTYTASDGSLTSAPAPGVITITSVDDDAPSCPNSTATVTEDVVSAPIVLPGCTDPDIGQLITCADGAPPLNGTATVNPTCLAATYTPNPNYCGTDSFTYAGTDNGAPPQSDLGQVIVTVTCQPDAPTCAGVTVAAVQNVATSAFSLNCIDIDGGPLTCTITIQGARGTVTITTCAAAVYTPNIGETGSDSFTYTAFDGLLTSAPATGRVTINADGDGDGVPDVTDNCPTIANPGQQNLDGDPYGDVCDLDDDGDGVSDLDEGPCGGDPLNPAVRPERIDPPFAGLDDDGDLEVDEALPSGSGNFDCDGDDYSGTEEAHIFSATAARDQDPCGATAWPADIVSGTPLNSTNRVNLPDLSIYIIDPDLPGGVRHLNTSPTEPGFDLRYDLAPGTTFPFTEHINLGDLQRMALYTLPSMFGGVARAFNGADCPWTP